MGGKSLESSILVKRWDGSRLLKWAAFHYKDAGAVCLSFQINLVWMVSKVSVNVKQIIDIHSVAQEIWEFYLRGGDKEVLFFFSKRLLDWFYLFHCGHVPVQRARFN